MSHLLSKPALEEIFRAGVAAADPGRLVRRALEDGPGDGAARGRTAPAGRVFLVGGGKAARAMAEAAAAWAGDRLAAGVIAVARGESGAAGPLRFVEGGHPLPDGGSRDAAERMLVLLRSVREDDLVVALVSGGGSAMISFPPPGVTPGEKEAVVDLLIRSGVPIGEINAVRKHLSAVKGGRMAAARGGGRSVVLVLSDVTDDDPSVVASGPFSPDPTTYADAMRILVGRQFCSRIPPGARRHIEAGVAGGIPETPKPGDPLFARSSFLVVGSNRTALDEAAAAARRAGAAVVRRRPGFLQGEARECARRFVAELRKEREEAGPAGTVVVAGGETTVSVTGTGRGGRSQEFALTAAVDLDGEPGIALLAAGTDGIDGPTDAAGAWVDGDTPRRARSRGLDPADHLARHDAYPLFRTLGDLVVTGRTGTNVADLAIGVVRRPGTP